MYLKVLSLKGIEYRGNVASFNVKTTSGEITILDHHRPLITILKKGRAVVTDIENKKTELEINSGFLEVSSQNQVNALVD